MGINCFDHRRFLNSFYTGRFAGSFARGLPFQENPKTGDCRISGACASLARLEKALGEETHEEVDLALANFSEHSQVITTKLLRLYGLGYQFTDLVTGETILWKDLTLSGYQFICLKAV